MKWFDVSAGFWKGWRQPTTRWSLVNSPVREKFTRSWVIRKNNYLCDFYWFFYVGYIDFKFTGSERVDTVTLHTDTVGMTYFFKRLIFIHSYFRVAIVHVITLFYRTEILRKRQQIYTLTLVNRPEMLMMEVLNSSVNVHRDNQIFVKKWQIVFQKQ